MDKVKIYSVVFAVVFATAFAVALMVVPDILLMDYSSILILVITMLIVGVPFAYSIGYNIGEEICERIEIKKKYEDKIKQWEAEGYKVEELKRKWRFK